MTAGRRCADCGGRVPDVLRGRPRQRCFDCAEKRNKERVAARQAAYRARNKERVAAQQAAYYARNKERVAAYQAAYYARNKERLAAGKAAE